MGKLYDRLTELEYEDILPMHMPGAKRNAQLLSMHNPVKLDITEITGFDNLHNATGIIKDVADRAAKLYGADEALLLVNGSSAGVMAAICGATKPGDKVLVARNVHRSVINALYLGQLRAEYLYPDLINAEAGIYGAVRAEEVERILEQCNSEIKAVIVTSPTYEGIVSDIAAIADVAHKYGAFLIVDEAHGAHLGLHEAFPENAVRLGADAVVMSLHKTLPSFTQTGLLAVNVHDEVNSRICSHSGEDVKCRFNCKSDCIDSKADIESQNDITAVREDINYKSNCVADETDIELQNNGIAAWGNVKSKYNSERRARLSIDISRIRMYWDMLQSTSPSYILMGSIDSCISLIEERGDELFDAYADRLRRLRSEIKKLHHIKMLDTDDISKIVLLVSDGVKFAKELREVYKIELEMASLRYVIAMTSIGDTDEGYARLLHALRALDRPEFDKPEFDKPEFDKPEFDKPEFDKPEFNNSESDKSERNMSADTECYIKSEFNYARGRVGSITACIMNYPKPIIRMSIYEALNSDMEAVTLGMSVGRTAGESICIYPPGINIVNPGEIITKEIVCELENAAHNGLQVIGVSEDSYVKCVINM